MKCIIGRASRFATLAEGDLWDGPDWDMSQSEIGHTGSYAPRLPEIILGFC